MLLGPRAWPSPAIPAEASEENRQPRPRPTSPLVECQVAKLPKFSLTMAHSGPVSTKVFELSDVLAFGFGCLALVLVVILIMAFRFPTVFASFFGSVETVELKLSGIKVRRASAAVLEAQKAKAPQLPAETPTRLLKLMTDPVRILWVDDHPENNRYEHAMLTALGLTVETASSNSEALERARHNQPDLVISDIRRDREGSRAGLELHFALEAAGLTPDLVYYVGDAMSRTTDFGAEVTVTPVELLLAVAERLAPSVRQPYVRAMVR